ncbi:hypothetical protein Taro_025966, partial [Colocasia esculenta]|nr:hypothetical protein [Colocasia esculenta]
MLELRSLDGIRWRFSSIGDTLLLWHLKCQKSFFYYSTSVGFAPFPSRANFSPEIPLDSYVLPLERMACSFWRWSQIWKAPFCRKKASSGSEWTLFRLGYKEYGYLYPHMSIKCVGSKCVDTTRHCVDTTCNCFKTGFWDSELVSTHRWTVSTTLADCVDTQADCVDTTGRLCRHTSRLCRHHWLPLQNRLLGQSSSVDTQVDCVDTTVTKEYVCFDQKSHDYEFRKITLHM